MSEFKLGQRIIVTRIIPRGDERVFGNEKYPRLGWRGTIVDRALFSEEQSVVEWDEEWKEAAGGGDLVFNWQISLFSREWDNENNV